MRFLIGCFFGSLVATVLFTTVCRAWLTPAVEEYPEFKAVCQEKFHVEKNLNRAEFELKLTQLELDMLRRAQRDPVNPAGPVVPAEDRIPAQQVPVEPMPWPVNPVNPVNPFPNVQDDVNDNPQQEEGEEDEMAAAATKTTALMKSPGATLALNSVDELMRLAEILYKGGACGLPNVDRPEKVAHIILHGMEIGLTPTQSLANLAMGKTGKISIMGDGALALVRGSGLLEDIKEFWEGDKYGDDRKGVCIVTRKGEQARRFEFDVSDANRAGLIDRSKGQKGDGPWITYRDRMLRYRPLGFALRDVFPDVLKGLYITEEVVDASPDPSIVNTEVKITGVTADKPAPATVNVGCNLAVETLPAAAPAGQLASAPPATQSPTLNQSPGSITDEQKEQFKQLHALVMAAKGVGIDQAARAATWGETLKPYGVASIREMSEETAARALAELGKQHDPFGHPAGKAGSSSQQPPGSSPQAA